MGDPMTPSMPAGEEKKSSRTTLWIVLGVVLVCCVCGGGAAAAWYLWNNGDRLLQGVGSLISLAAYL